MVAKLIKVRKSPVMTEVFHLRMTSAMYKQIIAAAAYERRGFADFVRIAIEDRLRMTLQAKKESHAAL